MKLLKGTLAGAAVLLAWGFASRVVLPWHDRALGRFSNEDAVLAAMEQGSAQSGVYRLSGRGDALPGNPGDASALVLLRRGGARSADLPLRAAGDLLGAFLGTLLLLQLGPRSLVEKLLFLLTAALLAWSGRAFADMAAWGLPPRHALLDLADLLVSWTLAGSVLAWLTHPAQD